MPAKGLQPLRVHSGRWTVRYSSVTAPTIRKKGPGRPQRSPLISTLNPELLRTSDYVDLSGRRCIHIGLRHNLNGDDDSRSPALFRYFQTSQPIAFPDKCAGFLYYHRDSHAAPLEGGLRFRCTPDDQPTSFSRGRDLLWPTGIPWQVIVPQLGRPMYQEFADQLLRENLASQAQISRCRELFDTVKIYPSRILFRLDQEFPVDFASPPSLTVVAEKRQRVFFSSIFTSFAPAGGFLRSAQAPTSDLEPDEPEVEKPRLVFPFTGSAVARFEPSMVNGRRVVHMRILRIVRPIASVFLNYEGRLLEPQEGELLTVALRGQAPEPWKCDLARKNSTAAAFRALWDVSRIP
ncbi:hypothetical protein B0H16DRAFT_392803 [Mycena metata]|uniref:Uncharacterized protein n=1 Tax=Mycena metata TaxID=1033252 RepID=A0AAD7HGX4_9AGAR|nr:hypothetical protein B0H16DRAFT_392803 [Mycena metata]